MRYQLQPFNQARFDACMAWVAKEFDRPISQYEAVKIHALADALHAVEHHNAIIGGTLRKLKYGPVDLDALNRSKGWKDDSRAPMDLGSRRGNSLYFTRKAGPTRESMFTPSEQRAILQAARTVFGMTFNESQKFFHGESDKPGAFVGKAWKATKEKNIPISWDAIVTAYAKATRQDADALKVLVCT